jgi:hypothetical protein
VTLFLAVQKNRVRLDASVGGDDDWSVFIQLSDLDSLRDVNGSIHQKSLPVSYHYTKFAGRGGGIRTPDPLLPKQMRYQTALRPDSP